MLLVYGCAAAAIGFVGLSLLIAFFAPPEPARAICASCPCRCEVSGVATPPPSVVARNNTPPPDVCRRARRPPSAGRSAAMSRPVHAPGGAARVGRTEPAQATPAPTPPTRVRPSRRRPHSARGRAARTCCRCPSAQHGAAAGANARGAAAVCGQRPAAPCPNHFALALYNQRIANYDEALTHYRALLAQNDRSAEVHNNVG